MVLTLVAIGPHSVWRGADDRRRCRCPTLVRDALDPVRAAGRLFWPVGYAMAFAAIVVAMRLPRASLILGAALAVQMFDLAPMVAAVRATSATAADQALSPHPRPGLGRDGRARVRDRVRAGHAVSGASDARRNDVARDHCAAPVPLRYFYASREPAAMRARLEADAAAFPAGRIDPTRLYVILDDKVPLALDEPRHRSIDGIAVIAAASVLHRLDKLLHFLAAPARHDQHVLAVGDDDQVGHADQRDADAVGPDQAILGLDRDDIALARIAEHRRTR